MALALYKSFLFAIAGVVYSIACQTVITCVDYSTFIDNIETMAKRLNVLFHIILPTALLISTPLIIRIFFLDSFCIRGSSMTPTFKDGDKVWVNKLIIGPRIYSSLDFSTSELNCFRIPGIRKLRVGDIAIINSPVVWGDWRISFKINRVFCKRCCGCPGDTIVVSNCHLSNSRVGDVPGSSYEEELILRNEPDSLMLLHNCLMSGQFAGMDSVWTIKNMGPIYVPAKGDIIPLTSYNKKLYAMVIEYETGERPFKSNLSEESLSEKEYTFRENYYFFTGDFLADSNDSRYLGFVPEKYVIGVVARIIRRR